MPMDKGLITGSTTLLILKLLEEGDMYGYQMIDTLMKRSEDQFHLKAGTLYPILHTLEKEGLLTSYEDKAAEQRIRKYYHLTNQGKKLLKQKTEEWNQYTKAVNQVLNGGVSYAAI